MVSVCISGIPGSPAAPTPRGIVASIGMKDPPLDSLTYTIHGVVFTSNGGGIWLAITVPCPLSESFSSIVQEMGVDCMTPTIAHGVDTVYMYIIYRQVYTVYMYSVHYIYRQVDTVYM